MRKTSYSLVLALSIILTCLMISTALGLPTTDVTNIVDPYKDGRNVTYQQLNTRSVTNSPMDPTKEHDPSKDQATLEATLSPNVDFGFTTNGPHGKFTTNTSACGRCHQLHQAQSARLIRFNTMPAGSTANNIIYGTCTYCHNFNGQSTYDVKDGMIWDTNDGKRYATSGGGFERMLVVEGEPALATVVKVTSSHKVNYTTGTKFRPPGGYMGPTVGGHLELTCTSCHNPHGTKHGRQLRDSIVVGDTNGDPTNPARLTNDGNKIKIAVQNPFGDEQISYNALISNFCATCHYDYKATVAKNKSGIYGTQKYRHKIGMAPDESLNDGSRGFGYSAGKFQLPVADGSTVECITCHYVHGTFTIVKGISTYDSLVVSSADNSIDLQNLDGTKTEPAKNLRLDNRGVCQNCHNWPSVSTSAFTMADVLDPAQDGSKAYGDTGSLLVGSKIISRTPDTITIRFEQYVIKSQAENTARFTLVRTSDSDPVGVSSSTLQPDGRTVVLRLASNLVGGTNYTLSISGIQDTNYVTMAPFSDNFTK